MSSIWDSIEIRNEFLTLREKYFGMPNKWAVIANTLSEKFGVVFSRKQVEYISRSGWASKPIVDISEDKVIFTESLSGAEATYSVSVPANKPLSLDDLIALFKVDMDVWEAVEWSPGTWSMTNKNGKFYNNYSGKVKFKKRTNMSTKEMANLFLKESQLFKELIHDIPRVANDVNYGVRANNRLLELALFDAHLGKLCWRSETGEDFDIRIATKRFKQLVTDLLDMSEIFQYGRILLPLGNDFLHTDNIDGTTAHGTKLDVDGRFKKVFGAGEELLKWAIDTLRQKAPVDVVIVPGNHDYSSMYMLGEYLKAWYRDCSNSVTIDNSPIANKYYRFGKTLIMFNHGDIPERKLLYMMPQERKQDWAETTNREIHVGHLHHDKVTTTIPTCDYNGIIIRQFKSLTGTDAWHYENGFVGSVKGADGLLYDKEKGMLYNFQSKIELS